ncbi:MAG TPA: ubiquinone/menaquinone biosynthesis methyltransferase [Vicinamibacterales bacterium]|nr:ubiquinone/menaquinone biosynthesis methyltransferase [Vicinamibacterales bacterium]
MGSAPPLPPLRRAFDTAERKRDYNQRLFSTIADRYDLITRLLSYGQDRRWKERLVGMAAVRPGMHALDLACGTGDIAYSVAGRGADVVALDLTPRMLQLALAKRAPGDRVTFIAGDMTSLPFSDHQFDVVTIGYGLRNVPLLAAALHEIKRVLRPGGTMLSLDFNRPDGVVLRSIYLAYLSVVGSALGLLLHGNADTYRYIPESIRRYPGARGVAEIAVAQGFTRCDVIPVFAGLMTIHRATS